MTKPALQFNPADFISDELVTEGRVIELNRQLDNTKVLLFQKKWNGFLGPLVASISFIWDNTISTACTNGVFMAWNPKFFESLDRDTKVTILAHEAWHIAFQHMARRGNRIPYIWNVAADYTINGMLKAAGYYMDGFPFLLDSKYNNLTTEQVYDLLMENAVEITNPQDGDFIEPGQGPESMQGNMTPGQIKKKAFSNIHNAATMSRMSKTAGDLPGEFQMMIDAFLKPKLPWQEILFNFFDKMSSTVYSYKTPNRRHSDIMLPGKSGSEGLSLVHMYQDVSGSISDKEIVRFNSEFKYIKETFNPEMIVLITFDTVIQDIYHYGEEDDFEKIHITGRGGTCLNDVWAHAKEHRPDVMVVFTDLHVAIPPEPPGVPLIWICSGNKNKQVPYGTKIDIEEER